MAAFVKPSSSAIICNEVPAKLCRMNSAVAASIRRCRVSVGAPASVAALIPGSFTIG